MNQKPLLIVIAGPTGSGKTDFSAALAEKTGSSILSADSRQVFRELKIGSAAPGEELLKKIPHYFVGSLSVTESFNAGLFEQQALDLLQNRLFNENPVQIVCGGTGLYIEALIHGMDQLPESDTELRQQLAAQLAEEGIAALQQELKKVDPEYFAQVDLYNSQRLIRALEVIRSTGRPYSSFRKKQAAERPFDVHYFTLELPREELYRRINQRTLHMLEQGWPGEVKTLLPFRHLNALQTVGYKELFDHLDGKLSYEQAVALIQQNTRRYAKRQLTWFRNREGVRWIDPGKGVEQLLSVL